MIRNKIIFILSVIAVLFVAVQAPRWLFTPRSSSTKTNPLTIVTTTGIIADVTRVVTGKRATVTSLMGPGVDPHLYKARAGDIEKIAQADIILYNGLHLEAKMADVFATLKSQKNTYALGEMISDSQLMLSPGFEILSDPHIWHDVKIWMNVVREITEILINHDPAHAEEYEARSRAYLIELSTLDADISDLISSIPKERRVLVSAHDAFRYFGRAYNIEVVGLQGVNTESEAGIADIQKVADMIVERKIPAIFIETSVSTRMVQALEQACAARGGAVVLGGELFSDALGDSSTKEGTYMGMMRHNAGAIYRALTRNEGVE